MTQPSVEHGNFTLERRFHAAPTLVFLAFTDVDMKRRWFADGDGWVTEDYVLDASEGGRETGTFRFENGPPIRTRRSPSTSCRIIAW